MKLELEINLEGLIEHEDYDFSLEDHVKQQIINGVIEKIYNGVKKSYEIDVDKIICEKIEKLVEKTFDEFLEAEVKVSDRYGDEKESGTLKDIIKKRFDAWLGESVNENGIRSTSHFGSLQSRMEYVIESEMTKRSKSFTDQAVNAVARRLEETLSEDLRDAIGKKISDKIGLNKLLPKLTK